MVGEKPGLYKYDFQSKKVKKFWSSPNERVVQLSFSENRKAAFFLTARNYGKRGVFPFITRVKLYNINLDSNSVALITTLGNGMQVFTEWLDNNNFKVALNTVDIKVSDFINQHTYIFNAFGKELLNEKKIYNLIKEGYPSLPKKDLNLKSEELEAELKTVVKDDENLFYLKKENDETPKLILKDEKKIRAVSWQDADNLLILSTADVTPANKTLYNQSPKTSSLYIYSLKKNKIINKWDGGGYKNFFLLNDALIFDNGFKYNSSIIIYDLNNGGKVDSIKVSGGCGLESIPEIPDYSA